MKQSLIHSKLTCYIVPFVLVLMFTVEAQQIMDDGSKYCRTLSMSGGGTKGSFEAGALWQMARMLNDSSMHYDVLSGVSVGAINSAAFALFPQGEEKEATEFLKNIWLNMKTEDVYKDWPGFEPYQAIFNKSGMYDSSPLGNYLQGILDKNNSTLSRKMMTAAVDVETGQFVVTDFDDLQPSEYINGIVTSASVPFVFPPTKFRGKYLMDALSCGWNVNMLSAIDKCMEIVEHPSQIIVDIIVMYPPTNPVQNNTGQNTFSNYLRVNALHSYYVQLSDIYAFMRAHPEVKYRYFVQASQDPLPAWELLNFTPQNAQKGIDLGVKDAKRAVEMGEGEAFKRFQSQFEAGHYDYKKDASKKQHLEAIE